MSAADVLSGTARWHVEQCEALAFLSALPDRSVGLIVTSPPYWRQRDYGVDGQIGQEDTPDRFVAALVDVFRSACHVLRDDGTCWINIGDSYAAGGHGGGGKLMQERGGAAWKRRKVSKEWRSPPAGFKRKDLVGAPGLLARALRDDGWYWRAEIVWDKSTGGIARPDRPWTAHETILLLSKSEHYHFTEYGRRQSTIWRFPPTGASAGTEHEAAFPLELPLRCIQSASAPGSVVCDPFAGIGTTGAAALTTGRRFIGCDLNTAYVEIARTRCANIAEGNAPAPQPLAQVSLFGATP
jgi:DNA modification methylase